jgi:uroporphyrin-III C-methyltransferase
VSITVTLQLKSDLIACVGNTARLQSKARFCQEQGGEVVWLAGASAPDEAASVPEPKTAEDWAGYGLILVDSGSEDEDRRVIEAADQNRIPAWSATPDVRARVQFSATVTRGPLRIAIDTQGRWPTVANWLRQRLDTLLPEGLEAVLLGMEKRREQVQHLPSPHHRRSLWYRLLDGSLINRAHQMPAAQLNAALDAEVTAISENRPQGEVFLVGAGPGDPDLLTIKALRVIGQADVVLYDRLVSAEIMKRVRADAERIHVGKQRSRHTVPQDEINQRLVQLAREGKTVVRLKGGDPFIFGRGGEEIETLADAGVGFQVVPGITAASGCAAYAGIPLTHRDYAQSVRFITGHLKNDTCDLPWNDFVQTNQTLVFYMGLLGLPIIARELMAYGMDRDMPVALVSKGTTPEQSVITGRLETIAERVQESEVRAPTLIIIGHVVRLRERLDWLGGIAPGRGLD